MSIAVTPFFGSAALTAGTFFNRSAELSLAALYFFSAAATTF